MKKIFVCSPYRAATEDEIKKNCAIARTAAMQVIKEGNMPLVPHLYFTDFLRDDDSTERNIGLYFSRGWLIASDEVWVIGDRITEGMEGEIKAAKGLKKKIRCFTKDMEEI